MRKLGVFWAAVSVAIGGCTVLHSSSNEEDGGIAYYLPKSVVVAKVEVFEREVLNGGNGGNRKNGVKNSKNNNKENNKNNEKKYEYLVAFKTTKGTGETLLPTRGEIIPDVEHRYQLTYSSNPLYHDRYCILTSDKGLLKSIEYAAEDATPKVVLALAELGRKVGAFSVVAPPETTRFNHIGDVIVTFDPFNKEDRASAAEVVNRAFKRKIKVSFDFPELDQLSETPRDKCRGDRGVCFRTKVKTAMILRDADGNALSTTVVEVVNPYHVGYFDLDRAFLVEKIARLGFEDGALTQLTMKKQSEALQAVKLPLAVVDAILTVPTNFIATATGNSAARKKELEDQRAQLNEIANRLATAETGSSVYTETCQGGLKVN